MTRRYRYRAPPWQRRATLGGLHPKARSRNGLFVVRKVTAGQAKDSP